MPIIESAMGVMKAMEIAQAVDNIVAITIGLEDYTADIGAARTNEGLESFSHVLRYLMLVKPMVFRQLILCFQM